MGPTAQSVATARWWIIVGFRTFSIVCLFYSFHVIVSSMMMLLNQRVAMSSLYSGSGFGGGSPSAREYSELIYMNAVDMLIRLLICVLLWSFSPFIASRLARVPRQECPGCGYSIASQTATCSECGLVILPERAAAPPAPNPPEHT